MRLIREDVLKTKLLSEWCRDTEVVDAFLEELPAYQQPDVPETNVGDTISRHAAIDEANAWLFDCFNVQKQDRSCGLIRRLEDLPSAQQELRWIPCSERLPSDEYYDETFIVTIQCEHHDGWDDYVTGYADWTPHGWDIQSYYIGQIKVTAWMPLPEPFLEGVQI